MESVRRFNERARAERRRQWIEYHECMCRLHTQLADEHEAEAQKLGNLDPDAETDRGEGIR